MRLLVFGWCACLGLFLQGCGEAESSPIERQRPVAHVRAIPVDTGTVSLRYRTIAHVHADKRTRIAPPLTGRILLRHVAVGDRVRAGDVLFTIDTEELQRERAVLTARLKEAESLVVAARSRIAEAEANAASLASELEYATYNENRIRRLNRESSAAENEWRQVAAARQTLAGRFAQAQAAVVVAADTLKAQEATAAVIASQLAELAGRIDDAEVRAPYDCTIEATFQDTGDWVTRNPSTDVLLVASNEHRLLMFTVPDRYYQGVKSVKAVTATRISGQTFDAEVLAVSNVLTESTRGCLLRCLVPETHGDLAVGLTLPVTVEVDRREQAVRIPNEAIRRIGDRTFVYRIGDQQRLEVVPVVIALEGDDATALSSGLRPGDRVAVGNLESLGDGVVVEVMP